MSKHMLKSLSAIPSTFSIAHFGGETAEGIFLSVKASEPIIQFEKWESPEEFSVERDTVDNSLIKLHAAKLHKNMTIGLTISTKKPTKFDIQLLIDKGEKTDENKDKSPFSVLLDKYSLSELRSVDIEKLFELRGKGLSEEESSISEEIFLLESKIKNLKNQRLIAWMLPQMDTLMILKFLLLLLIVFGGSGIYFFIIRPDLKKKSMKQAILKELIPEFCT